MNVRTELEQYKYQDQRFKNNIICIMDFEGTAYSSEGGRIIAIGYILYDIVKHEIVERYCQYINPCKQISQDILLLTNQTQDFLDEQPTIEDVRPHIENVLLKYPCYFYNAEADIQYLENENFFREVIDTKRTTLKKKGEQIMNKITEIQKKIKENKCTEVEFCEKRMEKLIEKEKKIYLQRMKQYEDVAISNTQFHYFCGCIVRGFFFKLCSPKGGFHGIQRSQLELHYQELSAIMGKIILNVHVTNDEKQMLHEFIHKNYLETRLKTLNRKAMQLYEKYNREVTIGTCFTNYCLFTEIYHNNYVWRKKKNKYVKQYEDLKLATVAGTIYKRHLNKPIPANAHNPFPLNNCEMTLLIYLHRNTAIANKSIIENIFTCNEAIK